ncbi:MAG: hypothetical protein CVT48_02130 [Thermoplasmata archaeon HGW-Thermoplasmata-1]|nr:MAG: hypothetical protein CVT48_02130 [Thermoplasmata archaeon HGW-Thermoplasmata-1]
MDGEQIPKEPLVKTASRAQAGAFMALLLTSFTIALSGTLLLVGETEGMFFFGAMLLSFGILMLLCVSFYGSRIPQIKLGAPKTEPSELIYVRPTRELQLRASSILLTVILLFSIMLELFGLMIRYQVVRVTVTETFARAMLVVLMGAMILVQALTFLLSKTFSIHKEKPTKPSWVAIGFFTLLSAAFIALGLLVERGVIASFAGITWQPFDALFLLHAALVSQIMVLIFHNKMPTIINILLEDIKYYRTRRFRPVDFSVMVSTIVVFIVLLLLFSVLIAVGSKVLGNLERIPTEAVMVAIIGVIVLVAAISFLVMFLSSKKKKERDGDELYKVRRSKEDIKRLAIIGVSGALGASLAIVALLVGMGHLGSFIGIPLDSTQWVDFVAWAVILGCAPYGIYDHMRQRRIRHLEERFPDFLRDMASSRQAGMTLPQAVERAAKGEYGELTRHIKKMSDQMSWDVAFNKSLELFAQDAKTPTIERSVVLINEATRSGGRVDDVLNAAAKDAREMKMLESKRRLNMNIYVMIIYVAFFVFVAVIAIMFYSFVPEMVRASEAMGGMAGAPAGFGGGAGKYGLQDYRMMYLSATLVQGFGAGFVGGLMGNSRFSAGLKHSVVMVLVGWLIFALLLPTS